MNRTLDRKDGYLTNRKLDLKKNKRVLDQQEIWLERINGGRTKDKSKQDLTLKGIKRMGVWQTGN